MKNKLLLFISFLIPSIVLAQFGAPWEKNSADENIQPARPKTFRESQEEFYSYWKDKDSTVKGCGYKVFKRWEEYWSTRLLADGTVPSTVKYWEEYAAMKNSFKTATAADLAMWSCVGPFSHTGTGSWSPGQGRVNVITEDPMDSKKVYLGAPNGGLWVSKDDGATWTPLTDNLPRIGVSAIAIDPKNTNILYIGMGDDEASDCPSIGILKSTDGGATWNNTGLIFTATGGTNMKCTEIFIDPANSSTLWASTSDGLYKTTNAATTWTKTLTGNIKDLCIKPGNSTILYAVTTNKFYKSTDGGTTFTTVTSGLPSSAGRFSIDVTPADPERVYLIASTTSNGYQGVYRSNDGGTSFTAVNTSTNVFENTQSWYTMPIGVSATNANEVYVGCLNLWKSTNGGTSFTRLNNWSTVNSTYTHADIHYIQAFKGRIYVGSDGGIYRSSNSGSSFTDYTKGVVIGQMYRMSGSPTNKNILVAGLQDNGGYGWNGSNWNNYHGADGMDCAVDLINSNTMYGFIQNGGSLYRSTNGGQSGSQYVTGKSGNWITPLVADKDGSLLAGFADLWRLKGTTWSKLSTFSFGGNLNGIEIAPSDSKVIYVFRSSNLYKTTNGGTNFTNITSGLSGTITSVEVHYSDPAKVWVTVGGWTNGTKIFYSSNGGANWINISYNLPNFPANIIKQEVGNTKNALYIGFDVGIYYTDNTLNNTWVPFMNGLPNSSVRDLEINEGAKLIRAATYGRGIWESPVYSASTVSVDSDPVLEEAVHIYPNPTTGIFNIQLNQSVNNGVITVELFNLLGEQVYYAQRKSSDNNFQINSSSLPNGVYMLHVKNSAGEWHKKVVKQ